MARECGEFAALARGAQDRALLAGRPVPHNCLARLGRNLTNWIRTDVQDGKRRANMVNLQKICRRQNHRFNQPTLDVRVDGLTGETENWSLGGAAIRLPESLRNKVAAESSISGEIADPSGKGRHGFSGRVVRVEPDRDVVAIEFSELSEGAVMMFVRSFRHMISGAA